MFIHWDTGTPEGRAAMERRRLAEERWLLEAQVVKGLLSQARSGVAGSGGAGGGTLTLTFDDIANIIGAVPGDPGAVSYWNSLFGLPASGRKFYSVEVAGNTVTLKGGGDIVLIAANLADMKDYLVEISDTGAVVEVGTEAFNGFSQLTSISFTKVHTAGQAAFAFCASLTSVSLPSLTGELLNIFNGCSSLLILDLPAITSLSPIAFLSTAITSVTLSGITHITPGTINAAFSGGFGVNIQEIHMPELISISEIGAFDTSLGFTTVDMPKLQSISGDGCFSNCGALTAISLPLVESIATECFSGCLALNNISLPACTQLGANTGDNSVFKDIVGLSISLEVHPSLLTCNAGSPDGDIQTLQANNSVTLV